MTARTQLRNPSVELMRIVGCLTVIGCHTTLPSYVDGGPVVARVTLSCLFADGVALFWFITGFFMFREDYRYGKTLMRFVRKIALPTVAFLAFVWFFYDFIMGASGILASIGHSRASYLKACKKLLELTVPVSHCEHLWYVFAYLLLLLVGPALNSFALYLRESRRHEDAFLVLSGCALILNAVTLNDTFAFSHHGLTALVPAATYALWGDICYRRCAQRPPESRLKTVFAAIGVYALSTALQVWLQCLCYSHDAGQKMLFSWYTPFGIVTAVCATALCLNSIKSESGRRVGSLMCSLASYTFPIYLVHNLFIELFEARGVLPVLRDHIVPGVSGLGSLAYMLVVIFGVFALSLLTCVILHALIHAVSNPIAKERQGH